MKPAVLVVTGASGSGKTTAVRALEARNLPGVCCYYFDSIGVPSPKEMKSKYGAGDQWQSIATQRWMDTLASDPDDAEVYVLDGQTRPSVVIKAAEQARIAVLRFALLDCAPLVRNTRLVDLRNQAELANPQMDCWAAYLRGQADALNLPVIETTSVSIDDVVDALGVLVKNIRDDRQALMNQHEKRPSSTTRATS